MSLCPNRVTCRLSTAVLVLACTATPVFGQKTDTVVFANGDQMTVEIRQLDRAKLTISTTPMRTVDVKWHEVVRVDSDQRFEVELASGQRYLASLRFSGIEGAVALERDEDILDVPLASIVRMVPIRESFWRRFTGSIDAGVSYLQQNNQFDTSLGARALYTREKLRCHPQRCHPQPEFARPPAVLRI
jgi:hypothetical protein